MNETDYDVGIQVSVVLKIRYIEKPTVSCSTDSTIVPNMLETLRIAFGGSL